MNSKELGKSGVHLPEIAFGTWRYGGGLDPLRVAIEQGAYFLDTAESYGNEDIVGEAVQGVRRHIFLASKVSPGNLKRNDLLRSADQSLLRLRTDYIDLYQLHGPNPTIPIAETMGAMEDLVDAGKVRFIGVSNFSLPELRRAESVMRRYSIVSNQVRFSLVDRTIEKNLLPYCQKRGITILAFSPLAQGIQNILKRDQYGTLRRISVETAKTEAQVALNWCTSRECVIAITKSDSVIRVIENCHASGWRLSADQIRLLDQGIRYRSRGTAEIALRRLTKKILYRLGY